MIIPMNYEIWKLPAAECMENGEPGGGVEVLCSPHMSPSESSLVSSVTSLIINWEIQGRHFPEICELFL